MISYEKLSKKERKKVDNQKRKLWTVNPITKRINSKKIYQRKRLDLLKYL